MAKVVMRFEMSAEGALILTESEMRALDALVGYGDDAFIEAFKFKLGNAYLRHHEAGLRSFFAAVRRDVLPALRLIDHARRDLVEAQKARDAASRPTLDGRAAGRSTVAPTTASTRRSGSIARETRHDV